MWNSDPGPDSSEWHGFGTYKFNNGTLTETLTSMSIPMRSDNNTFTLKVDVDKNSFSQIIETARNDTIRKFVEIYKRINK